MKFTELKKNHSYLLLSTDAKVSCFIFIKTPKQSCPIFAGVKDLSNCLLKVVRMSTVKVFINDSTKTQNDDNFSFARNFAISSNSSSTCCRNIFLFFITFLYFLYTINFASTIGMDLLLIKMTLGRLSSYELKKSCPLIT